MSHFGVFSNHANSDSTTVAGYEYVGSKNYFYFNEPFALKSTNDNTGTSDDLIVAEEFGNKTHIVQLKNASTIGKENLNIEEIATFDGTLWLKDFGVSENTNGRYITILKDNGDLILNGPSVSSTIATNVQCFDTFYNAVYYVQSTPTDFSLHRYALDNTIQNQSLTLSIDMQFIDCLAVVQRADNLSLSDYTLLISGGVDRNKTEIRQVKGAVSTTLKVLLGKVDNLQYANGNVFFYYTGIEQHWFPITTPQEEVVVAIQSIITSRILDNILYFIQLKQNEYTMMTLPISDPSQTPKTLLMGRSSQTGFYDSPTSIVSRSGDVFVVDSKNNRVLSLKDSNSYLSVSAPVVAAVNRTNNLYVLRYPENNSSAIDIFDLNNLNSTPLRTITVPYLIFDLSIDAMDNLYTHTEHQILYLDSNDNLQVLRTLSVDILKIQTAPDKKGIYVLHSMNLGDYYITHVVDEFDEPIGEKISTLPTSFTVDFEENAFLLYENGDLQKMPKTTKKAKAIVQTININLIRFASEMDMAISMANINTATGQQLKIGDLLITHKYSNAVIAVNSELAGIAILDQSKYPRPDYLDNSADNPTSDKIFRTVTSQTVLYDFPTEFSNTTPLLEGTKVIMVQEGTEFDMFDFVMLDKKNTASTNLQPVVGYVLRHLLTVQGNEYSPPIANTALTNDGAYLYRFPTVFSVALNYGQPLKSNTQVSVLDFVKYSINGLTWFKVSVDNMTGYILSHNLNIGQYFRPGAQRVNRPNATIKLSDVFGIIPISTASQDDLAFSIPQGTRVRVLGVFSAQTNFTRIEYYNSFYDGVVIVDVPTNSLQYDNITVMQIAAFIIMLLLIILVIMIILLYKAKKNKRIDII
ncbi:MAG: hypothetical protein LBU60_01160 [Clostridiales bacterium]|jgi:hypothetical protein|nr:hypothetical protein [Clostridiales bacterium]